MTLAVISLLKIDNWHEWWEENIELWVILILLAMVFDSIIVLGGLQIFSPQC